MKCEHAAVLHHEERGDEDKGCAAVHVDGGADGKYESGYVLADAQAILGRLHRDRQCCGATLREERHQYGGHHLAKNMDGVQTTRQQEQRQDDEELNHVAAQHHKDIFSYRVSHDTCTDLCRQLSGECHNTEGKRPD